MEINTEARVRVGAVTISMDTARRWIGQYTEAATDDPNPFAYPAYDRFDQANNNPSRVSDADLLAPVLLNVSPSVRAFYGLQRIRGHLEDALASPYLDRPLRDLDDRQIGAAVAPLYAVLDDPSLAPVGVRGTTLSKILHRKRPQSIVLHDRWVRRCYVGPGAPVPAARDRTWADYMTRVSRAIAQDIREQPEQFTALQEATSTPGELSDVRLLDILAWTSKGHQAPE